MTRRERLAATAEGIAVFPYISRGNYLFGAPSGYGALIVGEKIAGYYATTSIAYGLKAGLTPRPQVKADSYAFVLGDTDLMTGVGIEGGRIVMANP